MRAKDLMSQPAVTCDVNDTLNTAAQRMWDHDCGAIAVTREDGKLEGMLTDRDICMAAHTQARRLDEILVNAVMGRPVISATPEQSIEEIAQLMATHQVRRIPIVDPDGKPVGVLSLNDLAIESVQPGTRMKTGPNIAQTLAAIGQPRVQKRPAA